MIKFSAKNLFLFFLVCRCSFANDQQMAYKDLTELPIEELLQVEMVSVATGVEQSTMMAPAVTSVITTHDMETTAATDVDDVLETVPGLHVARSPISYYNPIYTLGSIYSTYNPEMLVLINGVPTNTLYTGGRILAGYGGMPTTAISRIEVIRGPGSALYGADALAGVINIITKTKEEIEGTTTGVRIGSFERRDIWLLHGNNYRGMDVGLSLNYSDTDGQSRTIHADTQTVYDTFYGTHASLAPGGVSLPHRNWDIDLSVVKEHWKFHTLYQKRDNIGMGSGAAQALDSEGRAASDYLYTDLTYHDDNFTKNWSLITRIDYSMSDYSTERDFVVYPPGAFNGLFPVGMRTNTGVSERHANIGVSPIYRGFKEHHIRFGMGLSYSEINKVVDKRNFGVNPYNGQSIPATRELIDVSNTSATFIPTGDRKNWHVFAQDIWTIAERWEMTSGIRYDKYSDFGSTVNPRLALVWKTTPQLVAKFLLGRAFRAPSFQELYQINNPIALGNKNLKPEKIQTEEIVLEYRPNEKWHASVNAFTYHLSDKILFISDENAQSYYAQNAGSQKGWGVVLEGGWQLSKQWLLSGSYAFQRAEDQLAHRVANVPQQDIYLRADWRLMPNWHLNLQTSWIMNRKRAFGDPRSPIDDYVNVDLSLYYKPAHSSWDLTFSIRNLLNSDIREPTPGPDEDGIIKIPSDLPMAGINYFIGLNYRF